MDALEAIRTRRAVKHYDADFIIPEEDEAILKEVIRHSPTSFNIQNWRILIIKDKDLRAEIRKAAWNQAQVSEASLLFLLCADLHAWDNDPVRYWADAPKEVQDILVPAIKPFYSHQKWQQRDEAMRSIGIGSQSLMIAAKAMGYDSCPMIGFDSIKVAELVNMPENFVIGMMVTVGKALSPSKPKGGFIDDAEVFYEDRF